MTIHKLFIDSKKSMMHLRVKYCILSSLSLVYQRKLMVIKMYLNETYSKVSGQATICLKMV
jgi:hypothetical protein